MLPYIRNFWYRLSRNFQQNVTFHTIQIRESGREAGCIMGLQPIPFKTPRAAASVVTEPIQ